jgi:hypothetical protein
MIDMDSVMTMALSSFIAAFIGWLFGRRKQDQDIMSNQLENMNAVLNMYKKVSEDHLVNIQQTQIRFLELQTELDDCMKLRRELEELRIKSLSNEKAR